MDFIGVFSSIYERKEEKYAFLELNYEFWITYGYYKGSTKFGELIAYKESTKFGEFNSFDWD